MEFLATQLSMFLDSLCFISIIGFACLWLMNFLIEVLLSFGVHQSSNAGRHILENEIVALEEANTETHEALGVSKCT